MNAEFGDFELIPPKPGACRECNVVHDPLDPHNRDSLYYQMRFWQTNGRFPTWRDAMAHCSDETKRAWTTLLRERGVPEELLDARET